MRSLVLLICCALAILLSSCTTRPLTDSEFRGFCYTGLPGRDLDCDTIDICNTFDSNVISMHHDSRKACTMACDATYNQEFRNNQPTGCTGFLLVAYNWCEKYCNTNYPE